MRPGSQIMIDDVFWEVLDATPGGDVHVRHPDTGETRWVDWYTHTCVDPMREPGVILEVLSRIRKDPEDDDRGQGTADLPPAGDHADRGGDDRGAFMPDDWPDACELRRRRRADGEDLQPPTVHRPGLDRRRAQPLSSEEKHSGLDDITDVAGRCIGGPPPTLFGPGAYSGLPDAARHDGDDAGRQ